MESNMEEGFRIIATGGTFDKLYDEIRGELTFKESHLPRILRQCRISDPVSLEIPLSVDSLLMNEDQRLAIAQCCVKSPQRRIIVVHGTDTMVRTANVVAQCDAPKDHVIVFTGAMVPYSLENSDAVFNLGCAFASSQLLPNGVYIAMSGRIFRYDQVEKNRTIGVFEGPSIRS
jgi:L-asparaginase